MKQGTESLLKFKRLQRRLGLPLWQCKGLLQSIWDFTAREAKRGDIGRFTDEDIEFGIEWEDRPGELIPALIETRWLDEHDEHRLIVHHWPHHCEESVHLALARAGETFADGSIPSMRRLGQNERKAILKRFPHLTEDQQNSAAEDTNSHNGASRAHKSACRAHAVRTTEADTDTDTDALADTEADTDRPRPEPAAKSETRAAARDPVGVVSVVSAFLDPNSALDGVQSVVERVLAVSREPPKYRDWWRKTAALMAEHDGLGELDSAVKYAEDCGNEQVRRAKDLGELSKPGAYIAQRCKRWLHQHGKRLPRAP